MGRFPIDRKRRCFLFSCVETTDVTPKPNWLIEDDEPLNAPTISEIRRNQDSNDYATRGSSRTLPPLALALHAVVIHNEHQWFGGAHLRLVGLVVRGQYGTAAKATVI